MGEGLQLPVLQEPAEESTDRIFQGRRIVFLLSFIFFLPPAPGSGSLCLSHKKRFTLERITYLPFSSRHLKKSQKRGF